MCADHIPFETVPLGPRRRLPISDPDTLMAALDGLDERERLVLELRYGLAGRRQHSLEEVGREIGVSAQRVRQIESRALMRLARWSEPS